LAVAAPAMLSLFVARCALAYNSLQTSCLQRLQHCPEICECIRANSLQTVL